MAEPSIDPTTLGASPEKGWRTLRAEFGRDSYDTLPAWVRRFDAEQGALPAFLRATPKWRALRLHC